MESVETLNVGMRKAGEILDAGLFWRGNLAKAVKRRDFRGTVWGIGGLSLFLFLYVWLHMQVVKLSYEVQGLRQQKQQLTNEYYYLKYRMHDVNSLSRTEQVAREKLGMVTPRSDQIVILEEDGEGAPGWLAFWDRWMKRWNGK
ncbi:MAG TPA: cell division protein FtsL [bacterium]|nr:cell division protein FtsL [bacterium]